MLPVRRSRCLDEDEMILPRRILRRDQHCLSRYLGSANRSISRFQAGDEHQRDQNRKDAECPTVPGPERLDHRCGFLSPGGSLAPLSQRLSSKGQNAMTPGIMIRRNPNLVPFASGSSRLTPALTKASENKNPTPA